MAVEPLGAGDPPTIGAYRLLRRLGAGGMGQVFLGRTQGGPMVAVKVVREELARQAHFRERFRAEVRATQRVSGRWTAPVLDYDTESAVPWVATAYVAGAPLQTVVESHGPLAEHSVWALALGLGQALTQIHGAGLVHRDLKPSNVMVALEGPKVIDFGIARAVDASTVLTRTGALVGSPAYMAPEQVRGERVTGAVDVFALGAVLAYAATGLPPFSWGEAEYHTVLYRVMGQPPQLGPEDGPLRGQLRELVLRCLTKEPGGRPGLAEIVQVSKTQAGTRYWLPGPLAAQLRRETAALLALDQPIRAAPGPVPAGAGPHGTVGAEPAPLYGQTTDDGSLPQAEWARPVAPPNAGPKRPERTLRSAWITGVAGRRNRYLVGAVSGAVALALAGWLVVANLTDAPPDDRGRPSGATPTPLADLVPQEVHEAGGLFVHVADREDVVMRMEKGVPRGFEADLIKAMGQRLGVQVHFSVHEDDDKAALAAHEAGGHVAAHLAVAELSDTAQNRREWGVDMVEDFESGYGVISRGRHTSLDELCGKTISTYTDAHLQEEIRYQADCERPLKILAFDHRKAMVDTVLAGKATAVVLQYPLAAGQLGFEQPDTGLTVSLVGDGRGPRGIAVPRGQTELRTAVAESLNALIKDGTYRRLLTKWHLADAAIDEARINSGS